MARVDPEDDTIRRFIALHYRYDPERRERRNVVTAAFDDEREFKAFLNAQHAELRAQQAIGDADKREHVSGVIHGPGARERQQNQHLLRRAVHHGVWPRGWDPTNPHDGISSVSAGGPEKPREILRQTSGSAAGRAVSYCACVPARVPSVGEIDARTTSPSAACPCDDATEVQADR